MPGWPWLLNIHSWVGSTELLPLQLCSRLKATHLPTFPINFLSKPECDINKITHQPSHPALQAQVSPDQGEQASKIIISTRSPETSRAWSVSFPMFFSVVVGCLACLSHHGDSFRPSDSETDLAPSIPSILHHASDRHRVAVQVPHRLHQAH